MLSIVLGDAKRRLTVLVSIIAVQEHRRQCIDQIETKHPKDGSLWVQNSADSQGNGGVGLLIRSDFAPLLTKIEAKSNRILLPSFRANKKSMPVTVVCVYSPTNCSPHEDIENFYDDLTSTVTNITANSYLVICGDFNAQLELSSNRNGILLKDFLIAHDLISIQSKFSKKKAKNWTYKSPTGHKSILDHIIIKRRFISSVYNYNVHKVHLK
jgi:exonuclease III